ncbi:Lgl C domain-containing protein [Citrus sinensis]|uniref:Lgl C domain-containing protein n=2 Tax=Citrus sinensis TaxID=2711 RepID=A0ACB8IYQ3_CITSI|nr:Lgl C domain-containing protein [Citrus sinensis]
MILLLPTSYRQMEGSNLQSPSVYLLSVLLLPHATSNSATCRCLTCPRMPGGSSDGLKSSDVDPRLVFHYGFPSGCNKFAYDPLQKILAAATKDGRIKLYGRHNTQALLESSEAVSTKFLQVWDIDKKRLSHVHVCKEEIASFTIMQHSSYMLLGDTAGKISVLKLDQESSQIVKMKYIIPLSASHGNEVSGDPAVINILPQPTAESKRILIIFRDGLISLWDIRESKSIFSMGGNVLQSVYHETKQVTSACWACPIGSKVAVGYSNGEILIWGVPSILNLKTEECGTQITPICKLNLGYKLDKIPISSLKWVYADGKASRLYIMGASDFVSMNLLQIVLLNEHTESRTTKLALPLSEPCIDMEIISSSSDPNKPKQDSFLLLGKSGHIYAFEDCQIERYLLQYQSRSPPSAPKEVMLKMPFLDSSITAMKLITGNPFILSSADEDYSLLAKSVPPLLDFETKLKDGSQSHSKVKNLFITGHSDGAINFWDVSCPLFLLILSLKQQSEKDFSLSGIPLTALYYDGTSRVLVSGDQSGMVKDLGISNNNMLRTIVWCCVLLTGSKKGNSHIIHSVKVMKVYLLDTEGPTVLYQKHIASDISSGIISLQFETCSLQGFEKNFLVIATKDSSVLDGLSRGANLSNVAGMNKGSPKENAVPKQCFVLLCSEKAAYAYSLSHAVQGVKKVLYKKKFHSSSCCWASTFYSGSDVGLMLLFTSGKFEIRSLPELSLLKETSIRGFVYLTPKPNSLSNTLMCSSWDGELIMVNGNQEAFFISALRQRDFFRFLDSASQVYSYDPTLLQEGLVSASIVQTEKKKGIFGSVLKGNKTKQAPDVEREETREIIEELATIFSTANFQCDSENTVNLDLEEDEDLLNIDDIDLDGIREKPKEQSMLAAMNKQILSSKLQAFKGKWKQMKGKNEKNNMKEEQQDEKTGAVDQIKKKYGFSHSGEPSVAKMAESKLHENSKKLQGINLKTTEMQDTARSFSSMAKEVLRIAEHDKKSS